MMSISRLWVSIWKCSRLSLSLKGDRITVYTDRSVGSGTGPTTLAPVRVTWSTMSRAAASRISWSYARSLIRMRGAITSPPAGRHRPWPPAPERGVDPSFDDLGDPSGPDRPPTLADGEPEALLHGDRRPELHD